MDGNIEGKYMLYASYDGEDSSNASDWGYSDEVYDSLEEARKDAKSWLRDLQDTWEYEKKIADEEGEECVPESKEDLYISICHAIYYDGRTYSPYGLGDKIETVRDCDLDKEQKKGRGR